MTKKSNGLQDGRVPSNTFGSSSSEVKFSQIDSSPRRDQGNPYIKSYSNVPFVLALRYVPIFRFKSAPYLKPSSYFTHSDIVDAVQSAVDTALDAALGPFWDVNEKIDWFEINQR